LVLVAQSGELLGRPWLTTVIDTYSRCIMGIHLGFDPPSADVVCLALRHAILPKQYPASYELRQSWGTYGVPQYLYTDNGADCRSQHLEQVTLALGILPGFRRKPADGGIVERPFGTLNSALFATLPGYTGSNINDRSPQAETAACLTLTQLDQLLVRYIVDNYNQNLDARMGDQSRIGRWDAERRAPLPLLGERELDICLLRRDRRTVYRNGYLQFANLTYQGEHLSAYAGETVILRYHPRDITTIWVYHLQGSNEVFLTRAHAMGWESETLSYAEAKALSQRRRQAGQAISNRSLLEEVRDRDSTVKKLRRQSQQALHPPSPLPVPPFSDPTEPGDEYEDEYDDSIHPPKPVPYVRVLDLEPLKRQGRRW
jgi:putative transposase